MASAYTFQAWVTFHPFTVAKCRKRATWFVCEERLSAVWEKINGGAIINVLTKIKRKSNINDEKEMR